MDDLPIFLRDLNAAQLEAALHPIDVPLQILAGPGSGKTKVLTCRIAHMIRTHGLNPSRVWALTFSNKAANEMRHRLSLLGINGVQTGTFHSICAGLLRKHARLVGLEPNFTICDADESKKVVALALGHRRAALSELGFEAKEGHIQSLISRAKSKGDSILASISSVARSGGASSHVDKILQHVYNAYEEILRSQNSVDFDDLLVFGVKLLKLFSVDVEHLFIDEFQDTNVLQFELMHQMAPHGCVSIVGDPDQSIYGWRSAETANLATMITMFPTTRQVFLEENYRSTTPILALSSSIIAQDTQRIARSLRTTYQGSLPVWQVFPTEQEEATYMASEIKHLTLASGGMLKYDDFAILLRIGSLSRAIETALQKEGIPNRVLGGHKFFDRMEVKDILAYLTLVVNPRFEPAWSRCVQRIEGVGEKTRATLLAKAKALKLSPLEVIEQIRDGTLAAKPATLRQSSATFVDAIRALRASSTKGASPAELMRQLLVLINYGAFLKKSYKDWEARIENINELISFARSFEEQDTSDASSTTADAAEPRGDERAELLRSFLERATLSTDTLITEDASSKTPKVTIATCHSAKGLEWGVVMIPAVETGIYPSYRSDDHDEERRLLYVACTRAQGRLYLSHASKRMVNGTTHSRQPSDFIKPVLELIGDQQLMSTTSSFTETDLQDLGKVLRRPCTAHAVAAAAYIKDSAELCQAPPILQTFEVKFTSARNTAVMVPPQVRTSFPQPQSRLLPALSVVKPSSTSRNSRSADAGLDDDMHDLMSDPPRPLLAVARQSTTAKPSTVPPHTESQAQPPALINLPVVGKRRLGMGRGNGAGGSGGSASVGYQNKRFKLQAPPT